jgi:hypothetical protein
VIVAAYTSPAGLAGVPSNCSGDMYRTVPADGGRFPASAAMPKSVSLLAPYPFTSTFAGL